MLVIFLPLLYNCSNTAYIVNPEKLSRPHSTHYIPRTVTHMLLEHDQPLLHDYAKDHSLHPQEARHQLTEFNPRPENQNLQKLYDVIEEHGSGKIPEAYQWRFQEAGYDVSLQETEVVLEQLLRQGAVGRHINFGYQDIPDQLYYHFSPYEAAEEQILHKDIQLVSARLTYDDLKQVCRDTEMNIHALLNETLERRYVYSQNFDGLLQAD